MILTTSQKTIEILKIAVTWPGLTAKEIAEEAGLSEVTAKNHLETLEAAGFIRCQAARGTGRYYSDSEIAALHFLAISNLEKAAKDLFSKADEIIYGKTGELNAK